MVPKGIVETCRCFRGKEWWVHKRIKRGGTPIGETVRKSFPTKVSLSRVLERGKEKRLSWKRKNLERVTTKHHLRISLAIKKHKKARKGMQNWGGFPASRTINLAGEKTKEKK